MANLWQDFDIGRRSKPLRHKYIQGFLKIDFLYPRNDPIGVRAAPTITTSFNCFRWLVEENDRQNAFVKFVAIFVAMNNQWLRIRHMMFCYDLSIKRLALDWIETSYWKTIKDLLVIIKHLKYNFLWHNLKHQNITYSIRLTFLSDIIQLLSCRFSKTLKSRNMRYITSFHRYPSHYAKLSKPCLWILNITDINKIW